MNALRLIGVLLVIAGALALAEGGFSYTKESTPVKLGPMELKVKEKESVSIPRWAGFAAVGGGLLLIVLGGRKP